MKINFWTYLSPSKEFPEGEKRFFLGGLENPGDLDIIIAVLKDHFGAKITSDRFAIWLRRVELEKEEKKLILYWDEDLDVFFVNDAKNTEDNKWLEKLIKEAIPLLEKYINNKIPVEHNLKLEQ